MKEKMIDQLIELKNTYGEALLLDKRRLLAFMRDYFPFAKREHFLIAKGVELDLYHILKVSGKENRLLSRNKWISTLHHEQLMDLHAAEEVVDLWLRMIEKENNEALPAPEEEALLQKAREAKEKMQAYYQAAEVGDLKAILYLANSYYNGEGTVQNYEEALKWYKAAAEQGQVEAMNYIGNIYYMGQGVLQNYEEALEWYKKAANLENAVAMNYIGNMYCEGKGVKENLQEGIKWYQRAARLGNYTAMFNIGYMYYEGYIGEYEKDFEWCKEEAKKDNLDAMGQLAYR